MTTTQQRQLTEAIRQYFAPRPTMPPADWCEANLRFDESSYHGPFTLAGAEYCREVLNDFADRNVNDEALVWGSQTRKTGSIMGGVAWSIVNDPCGVLWVMPSLTLAQSFSETRWCPLLKASPDTDQLIPRGSARWDFKKLQQQLGAATVNFIGSNSPANLSSRPARRVILDEVDKFDAGGSGEADAVNLADQRTKRQSDPQRWKTSTPTTIDGLIWQEYLKGDQRRYNMPCPHCSRLVMFSWSKEMTIMDLTGAEAFVVWDKEAKREKGWDIDRVMKSARAVCPHCAGHILDGHKTAMIRAGQWIASRPTPGFVSRQLSSLYACSPETTFGKLAKKFLEAKASYMGLQGFINGDLAEPWENQENIGRRTELILQAADATPMGDKSKALMTIDVQRAAPYFWYVIREWAPPGNSRLIAWGHCDEWEVLREIQLQRNIPDNRVAVDSGDQTTTVYSNCLRHGKLMNRANGIPLHIGWVPAKGREADATWKDKKTNRPRPFFVGPAALGHDQFELSLLHWNKDYYLDLLENLRKQNTPNIRWEVIGGNDDATYWRHLDANIKKPVASGFGKVKWQWTKRSHRWPDHLASCELMQMPFAMLHGVLASA